MVVEFLNNVPENVDHPVLVIKPESIAEAIALKVWERRAEERGSSIWHYIILAEMEDADLS